MSRNKHSFTMLNSDVGPLSTKIQYPKMRNTSETRGKQSRFSLEQLSRSVTFHYHVSQLQNQPPPLFPLYSAISSRSVQAQLKWVRLMDGIHWPGTTYLQTKFVLPFFNLFHSLITHHPSSFKFCYNNPPHYFWNRTFCFQLLMST